MEPYMRVYYTVYFSCLLSNWTNLLLPMGRSIIYPFLLHPMSIQCTIVNCFIRTEEVCLIEATLPTRTLPSWEKWLKDSINPLLGAMAQAARTSPLTTIIS